MPRDRACADSATRESRPGRLSILFFFFSCVAPAAPHPRIRRSESPPSLPRGPTGCSLRPDALSGPCGRIGACPSIGSSTKVCTIADFCASRQKSQGGPPFYSRLGHLPLLLGLPQQHRGQALACRGDQAATDLWGARGAVASQEGHSKKRMTRWALSPGHCLCRS